MVGNSVPSFKAIIVGGSVAGLTLAHTLDSAGIDYVVLEARDTVAPAEGQTIIISANGGRVLDQMGIYDTVARDGKMAKMFSNTIRTSDGKVVNVNDWPQVTEQQLGYAPGIFERQRFLQALYDELPHKEKIHVNKRVTSILDRGDSVLVQCQDGTTYRGDLVVGADGVRSIVRKEMQRLAPPKLLMEDKKSITAEYACFFGVSSPHPDLVSGDLHTVVDVGVSALLFVGTGSLPQWFFVTRLDRKYEENEIPRYTRQQIEEKVSEYELFKFTEGITVRDLTESATSMNYLALEEATYEVWAHKRIVCVGDSIHKMTPNLGQGGNQAIESAAALTNALAEMLRESNGHSETRDVEAATQKYQKAREKRAKQFVDFSGHATRREAMSTLQSTLEFLYLPFPTSEKVAAIKSYSKAAKLDHLPLPARLKNYPAWGTGSGDRKRVGKDTRAQL